MRLIDADALKERAKPHYFDNCHFAVPVEEIDKAPTVNAVEVVRCKNCGNYCENTGECNKYGHRPGDDGYCNGAIPKESER